MRVEFFCLFSNSSRVTRSSLPYTMYLTILVLLWDGLILLMCEVVGKNKELRPIVNKSI